MYFYGRNVSLALVMAIFTIATRTAKKTSAMKINYGMAEGRVIIFQWGAASNEIVTSPGIYRSTRFNFCFEPSCPWTRLVRKLCGKRRGTGKWKSLFFIHSRNKSGSISLNAFWGMENTVRREYVSPSYDDHMFSQIFCRYSPVPS